MSTYWDAHPDFARNPVAPLRQEFERLAAQRGWNVRGKQFAREWGTCGRMEFAHHFGCDDNRLAGWQAMCAFVGVASIPTSIKKCKAEMRTIFVNIHDLIDAKRTGQPVKKHSSAEALRKYTIKRNKIFPKHEAKQNRFLKVLLIEIFAY
ncbi:hypothetical protein GGX14DRAFT_352274 [Mycena pura]|uniref:Uncharacterized protein n=1 Tax=Mycena pura TaxID=153505 RepID=A0AAD7E1M3_9AGAR|nr:hypothetical protein GGX14DRAFT_352274 [Mycena pura]